MKLAILIASGAAFAASLLFGWHIIFPPREIRLDSAEEALIPKKSKEELIAEAREKSSKIRGLYVTADVASDGGTGATRIRNNLVRIADTTDINGLVIDVKEVCGPDYNEQNLKKFLAELKQKNIWAVARIVVAKDGSRIHTNPEWYLKRETAKYTGDECARKKHLRAKPASNQLPVTSNQLLWQDKRGGFWLDPSHPEVRAYILDFSKKIIDLGFDELQYDYIRFPSDGDIQNAIYPYWDGKTSKCAVMKSLFDDLSRELRHYKPDIILSADLFGYAALGIDTGIGQCIESLEEQFDYISFMVYPSHYYSGLALKEIPHLNLPAVNLSLHEARKNPDIVVERSLRFAKDFFAGLLAPATTTSATTTTAQNPVPRSKIRLRPWLEDFYHEADKAAQRPWGETKVRMQIEAAERVTPHGWLLWNAANVYTEGALKNE